MSPDPDHAHLYQLLAMLPGPDAHRFWERVAKENDISPEYVYEKLGHIAQFQKSPTTGDRGYTISYLCTYLIMFFGGDKSRLNAEIAHELFGVGMFHMQLGEEFTRDLVGTAWRLLVRYRGSDDAHLRSWFGARPRSRPA